MDDVYNLIEEINEERKRQNVSTRALADMCGMHQTQVVVILNHKVVPRLDTLLKIIEALGLSLEVNYTTR